MSRPKPKLPPRSAQKRPLRMPEPIDASPQDIARACMLGPPKREWDYLKKRQPDGED